MTNDKYLYICHQLCQYYLIGDTYYDNIFKTLTQIMTNICNIVTFCTCFCVNIDIFCTCFCTDLLKKNAHYNYSSISSDILLY